MAGEIQTTGIVTNLLPDLHTDSLANLSFWTEGNLIEWMDEAAKRLAKSVGLFVERDTSITTVNATRVYALPARHVSTLHVSFGNALRAASVLELEAKDAAYQSTTGTPTHWYEDLMDFAYIGLAPIPTTATALPIVQSVYPAELDSAKLNTLLDGPAPLKGYLGFSVLAEAYGREGEAEMPDVAQHCKGMAEMYSDIFRSYYGRAS